MRERATSKLFLPRIDIYEMQHSAEQTGGHDGMDKYRQSNANRTRQPDKIDGCLRLIGKERLMRWIDTDSWKLVEQDGLMRWTLT